MSRIFLSHSSSNNAEAVALQAWLQREGWKDEVFLDLDPTGGIAAGERWEKKLNEAANRCEAVLFLVSQAWIASEWCRRELNLAHRLNKRMFGVLIEDLPITEVPKDLTGDWQLVRLASGRDHVMVRAVVPITHEEVHVTFSQEGLNRLKYGLEQAGLDPKYFAWPPANEPNRPPYRGLKPLEADDAGIFFGRDAPVIEALDQLRGLRAAPPPRLMVILGASGAGKSSFLRAGLLPRLKRDDRNFLPLPVIRPERGALYSETGLLRALEDALKAAGIPAKRTDLRAAIEAGADKLRVVLKSLVDKATPSALDIKLKPPTLVLAIDQGEELFLNEGQEEARALLALLCDLAKDDAPALIVLFTIRSDAYKSLQIAPELEGVRQHTFSLPPMPKGSYADVIRDPARRLEGTARALKIEDALVDALLRNIEEGGAKDALPLLAFTLERLYLECGGDGRLRLADYEALGGLRGSIEAAVERAFREADKDASIPKDHSARIALLRRGLIPWLAGLDPETGSPRRRVARKSEIPREARPLIDLLVEQRLLATDVSKETGEQTIEPVHEALLRQWGVLQGWLAEDAGLLGMLQGVERASLDWAANDKRPAWLAHRTNRLKAAERLLRERPDLGSKLEPTDRAYLAACRRRATMGRARAIAAAVGVAVVAGLGVVGMREAGNLELRWSVSRNVLSAATERSYAQTPGMEFQECSRCPVMVVVPAGEFMMGSPETEKGRHKDEGPQHKVTIAKPFAVSKFEVTVRQYGACVAWGDCVGLDKPALIEGEENRPVIFVSWYDADRYVTWLSEVTGMSYRLLTEAEWEYAARAQTAITGESTPYSFGNNEAELGDYAWYRANELFGRGQVGKKKPNAFGLHDMHGNVWEWVRDCYHEDYVLAPTDGSGWFHAAGGNCDFHVARGGSWTDDPANLRSAKRSNGGINYRGNAIGIRVVRRLATP